MAQVILFSFAFFLVGSIWPGVSLMRSTLRPFKVQETNSCSFEDSCEVENVTSKSITVRWSCCKGTSFEVTSNPSGFSRDQETCKCINNVYYNRMRNKNENQRETVKRLSTNNCTATFDNYCPYGDYRIEIRSDGKYCSLTQTTLPSAPKLIETKAVAEDKIFLSWEDSFCTDYRKPIYLITWIGPDKVGIDFVTSEMNTELSSLMANTLYNITVRACDNFTNENEDRFCSANSTVKVTTKPGKPSQPSAPQIFNVTSEGLSLTWERPLIPRGPIDGYIVKANGISSHQSTHRRNWNQEKPSDIMWQLPPSIYEYRLQNMIPATTYKLTIFAFNYDTDDHSFLNGTKTERLSVTTKLEGVKWIENKIKISDSKIRLYLENNRHSDDKPHVYVLTSERVKDYYEKKIMNYYDDDDDDDNEETERRMIRISWDDYDIDGYQYNEAIYVRTRRHSDHYNRFKKLHYDDNEMLKESELEITSLRPNTKYTFILQACTSEVLCSDNKTLKVTTKPQTPSQPENLHATALNMSSIVLTWDLRSPNPRNPIDGYIVTCRRGQSVALNDTILGNDTNIYLVKKFQITCLHCSCGVRAFVMGIDGLFVYGAESVVNTATKADKPSEPEALNVNTVTSDEIILSWSRPREPRGPIEGYYISAHNDREKRIVKVSRLSREHRFQTLNPWTEYNVTVFAFNYDADGENLKKPSYLNGTESTVVVKTKPAAPSPPRDVKVAKVTSDEILLKWKHPSSPGGPVDGYIIRVITDESEFAMGGATQLHRLTDLSPATNYTIVIFAYNMDEEKRLDGKEVVVIKKTRELSFNEEIALQLVKMNRHFNELSRIYKELHQVKPPL